MQRIATSSAVDITLPNGRTAKGFAEADPQAPQAPTQVSAEFLTAIQREDVQVIEGQGLALSKADNGQLDEAVRLLTPASVGLRNLLLNGDMRLSQRRGLLGEAVAMTSNEVVLDRWAVALNSASGVSMRQVENLVPQAPSLFTPYALELDVPSTPPGNVYVQQAIEDVRVLGSRRVQVTAWAQQTGSATLKLQLQQLFGSGGSSAVSTQVFSLGVPPSLASWARFEVTVDIPSVDGKTVVAPEDHTRLRLFVNEATRLRIAPVQLEVGAVATRFEQRPESLELALARRYFEKSYPPDAAPGLTDEDGAALGYHSYDVSPATEVKSLSRAFQVRKRVTPTMSWFSDASGTPGVIVFDGSDTGSVSSTLGASEVASGYPVLASLVGSGDGWARGHWTAEAEF